MQKGVLVTLQDIKLHVRESKYSKYQKVIPNKKYRVV
jgi:hypothetical protein